MLRRRQKAPPPLVVEQASPAPEGWDVPARFNFTRDVVEALAAQYPRVGLTFVDREGIVDRRRFGEVAADAARWAHLLRARLDRGDRVLVVTGKVPAWHGAMMGALKGGLVAVPCSDMLRAADLAFRARHSGARLVVADRSCEVEIEEMVDQLDSPVAVVYLDEARTELSGYMGSAPTEDTAASEHALILYTSGTTKDPRGVVHTHGCTWAMRAQAEHWLTAQENDVVWCTAGTGWAKSIWNVLVGPWSQGAEIVLHESGFDPEERLELMERLGVSVLCQAPTEYRLLAKLDALATVRLPRLRHAVSAGEPLNPEVIERFRDTLGITIHDGYGQTESALLVANVPGTEIRPGSMGLPTPGHDVGVIDADGQLCPPGVEGDLALHGRPPTLFAGYWNAPEETKRAFRDGWYVTGDRALRDEDGYLWFVGRADDVILSAAYRIGPFEVESALLQHPAVAESAVVGAPDADRGQVVKAFVVLRPGTDPTADLIAELQEHVKSVTAPYKYPREIAFVDELPKTTSGKIKRADLRRQPQTGYPEPRPLVIPLPVDEVERAHFVTEAVEEARQAARDAARREAAAAVQRAAAESARRNAEAAARLHEEAMRRDAAEAARREAVEAALREAEEAARLEADEAQRTAAEEAARIAAAELARREGEEAARVAAAEAARREAEDVARREAEAVALREAEEAARLAAEEAAVREAEEAARVAAEEQALLQAEEEARREAEEAARREAELAARIAAEAAARREAEEAARAAAEEQARLEAEKEARREAEEAARREAEDAARIAAAEAARREAEKAIRAAAEEQARLEAEETARREAEAAARREAEAAALAAAEEQARLEAEEVARREAEREAEAAELAGTEEQARREERERAAEEALARIEAAEAAALAAGIDGPADGSADKPGRRERRAAEKQRRELEKQQAKAEAEQRKRDEAEAKERAKRDEAEAKERAKAEAEQRKRDEAEAKERAKRDEADAKERTKAEAEQRKRDEAAAKERAKAEAEQRKRDERAAKEEAARQEKEERRRQKELTRGKGLVGLLSREEEDELEDDGDDEPVAPIDNLLERLAPYSRSRGPVTPAPDAPPKEQESTDEARDSSDLTA
ncbi:MAG TPA: AMP-binding protein [Gaiella sp.]